METIQLFSTDHSLIFTTGSGKRAVLERKPAVNSQESDELTLDVCYRGAYGMGERFDGLNQKGNTVVNCVTEKFCHQGEFTYLSAPFFVTDSLVGIYIETDVTTTFYFGEPIRCEIPHNAAVFLFTGSMQEIIASYMKLFGAAVLPPKYAFGIWASANRWNSRDNVEELLYKLDSLDFPASVLVLEAWSDEQTFYIWNGASHGALPQGEPVLADMFDYSGSTFWSDPGRMIRELHERGIRLVLWQIPVFKEEPEADFSPAIGQQRSDIAYAIDHHLCIFTENGEPYRIPEGHWFAGSLVPDFTNPETREYWFQKRQYLLDMGVDGFKTDGGEFIYREDLALWDGTSGREARNAFAQTYVKAYGDFIGQEKTRSAGRVLFSRAGFAGAHRSPIHWAGDQQSENGELKSVLTAGLSAAMTGIPFWSFDIGGFAGSLPSPDLYLRATMLACFIPVMQWHSEPDGGQFRDLMPGMGGNNERSPWNIATYWKMPELLEELRFWHKFRMRLLPYLYSTAVLCSEKYKPMIRPLVYEWQDEEAILAEDEFLLGESMLVAPLLEEESKRREVWLPDGIWHGMFSHRKYQGAQRILSDEYEKFPVYLRSGRAIVLSGEARAGIKEPALRQPMYNSAWSLKDQLEIKPAAVYHILLAGNGGQEVFVDEERRILIQWNPENVSISGGEDCSITWERV